ncbi:MAG: 4Fe-4S binding protein [Bacteroidales bacterium]|jgi:iron only hydrogenase large subunit-like protein|nr:4Fe-4S binding protein [Bacteroidales bacterium]
MEKVPFFHALTIDEDSCIGCSHCMKACPTEALRVRDGKAKLQPDRCIDCGNCFKVCPTKSIYIKQDDFDNIFNYACRVALVPSVFMGQFPNDISVSRIYQILKEIGFTYIIETEATVPIYTEAKNLYAAEHPDIRPLISTYCPAIVRLIQVKFPGLTENLIPLRAPIDLTAMYIRRKLEKEDWNPEDIGIFYITPCAAKIAAVKCPVGEDKSLVDGVINMDSLYNRVFKRIKEQGKGFKEQKLPVSQLSADGVLTALTNGERRLSNAKHSYSIDEIHNVIEFLEKVENDEVENVDFLELRACDQSCPGGILTCDNRFMMCERIFARARKIAERERNGEQTKDHEIEAERNFLARNVKLGEIHPRSMLVLDENINMALLKMQQINVLRAKLPQKDCGVCGAPTCDALARDVVMGEAQLSDCIFMKNKD